MFSLIIFQTEADMFFPNILERWGNVDEPDDLKTYLDDVTADAREDPVNFHPWRPNCQMTPTVLDIILQKCVKSQVLSLLKVLKNSDIEHAQNCKGNIICHDTLIALFPTET